MYTIRAALFFILFTIIFNYGTALYCYKCAGPLDKNEACEVDLKKEDAYECYAPKNETVTCIAYIESRAGEGDVITRDCGTATSCERYAERYTGSTTNFTNCYQCTENYCNDHNSSVMGMPSVILTILFFITLLQFK